MLSKQNLTDVVGITSCISTKAVIMQSSSVFLYDIHLQPAYSPLGRILLVGRTNGTNLLAVIMFRLRIQ